MALQVDRFDEVVRVVMVGMRVHRAAGRHRLASAFLDLTIGSEAGFFEPLTRALGIASRSSASLDEIIAYTDWLMAERAKDDPGRRARYGERWVRSKLWGPLPPC